jgi:GT2 family glycosyltransferase
VTGAPALSFVIPVRNDAVRLRRCIASIRADSDGQPVEIVVADNGSVDATADVAREAGAIVVALPDRVVADVRNTGARAARGEWLAFVDADHELEAGWTAAAMRVMADHSVSAAGADYHAPADGTWVQQMYDNLRPRYASPTPVDWLPSGNLVIRRDVFATVGGFDTTLESCEDVDFCRRLRAGGGRLVADPALRSIHHGDPATLRALFLSELWRGRDNLRVTLRDRINLRSIAGLALTMMYLPVMAGVAAGLVTLPFVGARLLLFSVLAFAVLVLVKASRLLIPVVGWLQRLRELPQAVLVAATYDSARALALLTRVGHDTRRKA